VSPTLPLGVNRMVAVVPFGWMPVEIGATGIL
jgi:predicted nucleotide-binding protein (sugar kinase/HSP70/actin superfamily)